MTLKEKLQQEKIYINPYDFKLTKESVEKFEQITYNFAIDFVEWLDDKYYQGLDPNEYHRNINEYRDGIYYTAEQLLEIFKTQKIL